MVLDLETIYVVTAMACFVLGAIQIGAFVSQKFGRWPLWWGVSDLLVGLGSLGVVTTGVIPFKVAVFVFNAIMTGGFLMLVIAVRAFAGSPARWRGLCLIAAAIALPTLLIWNTPADYSIRIAVLSALSVFFDLCVIREGVGLARKEGLDSARILVAVFGFTALMFTLRTVLAGSGRLGGHDLFSRASPANQWIMASATILIVLRGTTLILMAAERHAQRLRGQAQSDPLTGALNRTGVRQWFDNASRSRSGATVPVALMLVDIDHFKTINDTPGHAVGDQILKLFASVARASMEPDDMLGRHGGDEFILARRAAPMAEAAHWAETIRSAFVAAAEELGVPHLRPTVSIGVAHSSGMRPNLEGLLAAADGALYRAKSEGRNRVECHQGPIALAA